MTNYLDVYDFIVKNEGCSVEDLSDSFSDVDIEKMEEIVENLKKDHIFEMTNGQLFPDKAFKSFVNSKKNGHAI